MNNYEKYPDNIFPPEKIRVYDDDYTIYRMRFNNLGVLYDVLKSNPRINKVFKEKLASENGTYEFAGKPYEDALEDLVGIVDPGYDEFLALQKDLNSAKNRAIPKYKTVATVAGGHVNIPAYSAGAPLCYETEERITKPKFARIYTTLSYHCGTSKEQVLNRAIIMTNILKSLENARYAVDINAFELSEKCDELFYAVVQLKRQGEKLNMQALYKTLCPVEFLRRILFRTLEISDIEDYRWRDGYGRTCSEDFTREALKIKKDDLFFDQPSSMGIRGDDLSKDFERAIKHLSLEDKIDVEKAKREFNNDVKVLEKRR